jgi:DNA-directed RNA polymerase subunit RPC12/RpoP
MRDFTCLRCGETMQFYARERLQLGKTGWVLGDLPNLFAGALDVSIYVCPACRKLEFYADESASESEEELPQKTCPACGTVHDFDYPKCPNCKFDYYAQ